MGKEGRLSLLYLQAVGVQRRRECGCFCHLCNAHQSYKDLQCAVRKAGSMMCYRPARNFRGKPNIFQSDCHKKWQMRQNIQLFRAYCYRRTGFWSQLSILILGNISSHVYRISLSFGVNDLVLYNAFPLSMLMLPSVSFPMYLNV